MNDHQRTEAQLIEELENLRLHHAALLDSVPDAIITTDLQFTIRGWNRVAQSLYGWHPEEAVGRRMGELVPTSYEDQDSARARAQLIETGHWTGEVRQTKKDGTAVHVHASVSLVKDETGHAFGVVAVNRDVSERRRTESELVRAVREWQTTFDVTNDAIWILDSDERVLRCNETARKLFQRSKDQIVGHFCWSIVHGTSAPIPQCPVSRAKRSLARETMELRIGEQWFEVTADPILDDAGRYAGAVHIISDITERKRAEMALRSNEQRLRTTLYSIGDGVITTDQHGQVQVMNAVAEVLTGWTEREASGRPLDEVFQIVDERTRTPLQNPVSRVLQTGEVLELASHALLISRHGKEHPIADSGAPIRDEGGTVVGVVLVFRDQSHERLRLRVTRARLSLFEFATHHSLDELLTEALDAVGAVVDSPIGFYHFVDSDEKSLLLQQWSTRTVQDFCQATGKGLHYAVESAGVWADAIRTRAPVVHNDYDTLPEKKGMPEGHARVVRELVVPVVVNDRVVAVLGVGNKPTDYTEIDVEVVSHLAEMTWQIVRQKRAEEALRESEERMQAVFASTPDYLMLLDREHKIQLMNRALPGFSHAELHERPLCELASVEDQKRIGHSRARKGGCSLQHRLRSPDRLRSSGRQRRQLARYQ
jgi:PAS domain S-box-containing protein